MEYYVVMNAMINRYLKGYDEVDGDDGYVSGKHKVMTYTGDHKKALRFGSKDSAVEYAKTHASNWLVLQFDD